MQPVITAFADSPDRGRGFARDMRVRWALAEVGQAYDVRLLSFAEMKEAVHRTVRPFGQIPTFEADGAALFETGAIILHIAERHAGLLPADSSARARVISWMFAAVGTVEPVIVEREAAGHAERDSPWYAQRLPIIDNRIRNRLADLSTALGEADWLVGDFSAADVLMIDALRRLHGSDLLSEFPGLARYVSRGEERPAFRAAFDAQWAVYQAKLAREARPG